MQRLTEAAQSPVQSLSLPEPQPGCSPQFSDACDFLRSVLIAVLLPTGGSRLDQRPWPFLTALSGPTLPATPLEKMRQLKGKPKKESSRDKKERKQAMQEARQQITTVVLPTLAVVVLLIVVFVYVATRPTVTE